MAVSKKPRKKRSVRHAVSLTETCAYWQPVRAAVLAQCGSPAIASVSPDSVGDGVYSAILNPPEEAVRKFDAGGAQFADHWVLLQACYFLLYALEYVTSDEHFRFSHQDGNVSEAYRGYWLKHHAEMLDTVAYRYGAHLTVIAERSQKTGVYGMSGDERTAILNMLADLRELLDWGSIRMVYTAMQRLQERLVKAETRWHSRKLKEVQNVRIQ